MDIKPFAVRYKAGSDKKIIPGLHGRFATMAQARAAMEKCALFFGGGKKNADGFIVGRAIIGIVVDKALLVRQEEEADVPDELEGILPDVELTEMQHLQAENERLKAKLALLTEPEEDDEEEDDEEEDELGEPVAATKRA